MRTSSSYTVGPNSFNPLYCVLIEFHTCIAILFYWNGLDYQQFLTQHNS